jgi:polysaccharide export outer membrane protein
VPARGHTLDQLERNIASRLAQGYLRSPNVAAEIVTYRPFFILGEVRNPGQYPFVAGMTVRTAVAIAGGFTPRAAKRKVSISRQIRGQVVHGSVALEHPIRPGDTINVDERFF